MSMAMMFPLACAIIGLIVWAIAKGIWAEAGKILFFCGAFWLVADFAHGALEAHIR